MMKILSENEAFTRTAPRPYVLITNIDINDRHNVMGATWVSRVSQKSFLLMVAIDYRRFSHEGIHANREFVVNYPAPGQERGAWFCGTKSGRGTDKIHASGLRFIPSEKVKSLTLDNAAASFECRVIGEHVAGDHTIFVGEVLATRGETDQKHHLFASSDSSLFALDSGMRSPEIRKEVVLPV
jgi:flavin reductase (DIM6/NTAB) family NADH-FMN oxidoreductase RutF